MKNIDPKTGRPVVSSAGKFMGWNTIYGRDGEHGTPYMTRAWIGRLRLHIFHRGDADPDCHDHPWDFWTFPLTPYMEEVVEPVCDLGETMPVQRYEKRIQVVPAWRWSFRPAAHCHRVIARARKVHDDDESMLLYHTGALVVQDDIGREYFRDWGKIVTIVWTSKPKRSWGFLKNRAGQWCWTPWKEYVFGGGKDAPCK